MKHTVIPKVDDFYYDELGKTIQLVCNANKNYKNGRNHVIYKYYIIGKK